MRKFSRWMQPVSTLSTSDLGWAVVALLVAAFWPLILVGYYLSNWHLRRLASERSGEDIGTFGRSFDRRTEPFDPWVIRATWDALHPYVAFSGGCLPLRQTDRLDEDFRIDPDDIDDFICEVATRSAPSLDHTEVNPFYGKIVTVGDVVRAITLQPRAADR